MESNRSIISNWETSKSFVKSVLNSKRQVPNLTWQREHDKLSAQLQKLNGEYQFLKSEVTNVDRLRNNVYDILRRERQREQPHRAHDFER